MSCTPAARPLVSGESLPIVHMRVIEPTPARTEAPVKFRTAKCPASTSEVNVQPFVWESETLEFAETFSVEALQCVSPFTVIDVAFDFDGLVDEDA